MFVPPFEDQLLALTVNAGVPELAASARFAAASPDVVEAIVDGAGRFAAGCFAPLNTVGDRQGAKLVDGRVVLPDGYPGAYADFVAQGWNAIAAPEAFGGQGLPFSLAACVMENLGAANLAFSLLPMLSVGAIEALEKHGSADQKAKYLPKLVSGEWPGTMNLTEPQAGSDVGALVTSATPIETGPHAGKYRIKGTKIYITWGEHELAENIIHLVLARLPGAPAGSRGISLFLVPRFHVRDDGSIGLANDVKAISLEHKMGIHASPTCVMSYGDHDKCIGELVGEANQGLRCMFTMMNSARINVGAQGVQVAEAAWQKARSYAVSRVQSPRAGGASKAPVPIAEHPDVRRMLLRMRALTEAARALLYYTCGQVDRGTLGNERAARRADVLVPLLKAWGTDVGCEVTSLAVQVHGGAGFIEETGVAQHFRDARIAPIYEGTNGIQAADLVTRKLAMDGGEALRQLMEDVLTDSADEPVLTALAQECQRAATWMLDEASLDDRLAGSVAFLGMCAVAVAGWQIARQAAHVGEKSGGPSLAKPVVARWFMDNVVAEALARHPTVRSGSGPLYALTTEALTS